MLIRTKTLTNKCDMNFSIYIILIISCALNTACGEQILPKVAVAESQLMSTNVMNLWVALHMLRCADKRGDPDAVAIKVEACVLLHMPSLAHRYLKGGSGVLRPMELASFEGSVAREMSDRNSEYARILKGYLSIAGSSNALYQQHLSNLRAVIAGSGIVTNFADGYTLNLTGLRKDESKPIVVVNFAKDRLSGACVRGAYQELADDMMVIEELRRQACWEIIVVVSQMEPENVLSIKILPGTESDLHLDSRNQINVSAEKLLQGGDDERAATCEGLVLEALRRTYF